MPATTRQPWKTLLLPALLAVLLAACGKTDEAPSGPQADGAARLAKAEAMFQERCKTAGEFIHRTAENVEGVFLMKLRPNEINYGDQYRMDDPHGRDLGGDGYIINFLLRKVRTTEVDSVGG